MTSTEIRDRRTLRYRGLLVKKMVQMKNRISGLLMQTGVSYNKQRLHKAGYFAELMSGNEEIDGDPGAGLPAPHVPGKMEAEPFDNGVRKTSTVSKEMQRREAEWQKTHGKTPK